MNAFIQIWSRSWPEWVTHAYLNDPTVHRIVEECAFAETSKEEMQWRLCAALYEQRNQWRDTALHLKKYEPLVFTLPNPPEIGKGE